MAITTDNRVTVDDLWQVKEDQAVGAWRSLLDPHFEIREQVEGEHWTGRTVRLDLLLRPRFQWRGGGRQPIGFEVKKPVTNEAKLLGQSVDYANSRFDIATWGEGKRFDHIFVAIFAPSLLTHHCDQGYFPLEQMLGRLGVVLFHVDNHWGLHLRVSGNTAWSERRGCVNMNWAAQRKFGSR